MEQKDNRFFTLDGIEYNVDYNGVIHQTNIEPFDYNTDYIDTYRSPQYQKESSILQGIRLGSVLSLFSAHYNRQPKTLLDYGYGDGSFLNTATRAIDNCFGYDVAGEDLPKNVSLHNIKAYYDVVTMWDVYEHLKRGFRFSSLGSQKMVVMSLPNVKDKDFEAWKHRKPNEHIRHYTPKALQKEMEGQGFTCIMCNYQEDTIRKGEPRNIMTLAFIPTK